VLTFPRKESHKVLIRSGRIKLPQSEEGYFTYPTALYSAGHACLDMDKVNDRDSWWLIEIENSPP
jgi:hypothetical protein